MNKQKLIKPENKLKEVNYLSSEDIILILNLPLSLKEKTLFLIFLETGCTISEFTKIKVKHIKKEKNKLKIRKETVCKITKETTKKILELIKEDKLKSNDFLFNSRESSKISERRVQQILSEIGKKINIKLNQRTLRTTFVIRAFLNRISLKDIENILGINSAQNYLYKFFEEKQEVKL